MLIHMLLFIFPKNEVDIWRVSKNALEKYIFTDFFPQSIKWKRSHLRGGSNAN